MSVAPLLLVVIAGAILAVVGIVGAFFVRGGAAKAAIVIVSLLVLLPCGYVLCSVFVPEAIDARFRAYSAFYRDIETGMTRDEVLALIERHYPESGQRKKPKVMWDAADELGFFMNPEESGEPNCEGIFLKMGQGKVVEKQYSRD